MKSRHQAETQNPSEDEKRGTIVVEKKNEERMAGAIRE